MIVIVTVIVAIIMTPAVGMGARAWLRRLIEVVLMKVENPLQQKHNDQTAHKPKRHKVYRNMALRSIQCVGQKMENSDAQHDTGNKTHNKLCTGMIEQYKFIGISTE